MNDVSVVIAIESAFDESSSVLLYFPSSDPVLTLPASALVKYEYNIRWPTSTVALCFRIGFFGYLALAFSVCESRKQGHNFNCRLVLTLLSLFNLW